MKTSCHPSIQVGGEVSMAQGHETDLDALVRGCQRNERPAQQRFYEEFRTDVYQVVLRMVGMNDASDLLQQTFVQAYRSIGQFAGQSHVRTWLYRLAVNECLQHLRKRKRRHTLGLEFDPLDRSPGHESQVENKEIFGKALERLDPDFRAVFVLREVEKMTYAEIASALEINEGTAASRLNTARRKLKEILVDLGWEP